MKCEIEGCERKAVTNNKVCGHVCSMHYKRFKRHGSFENRIPVVVRRYKGMKCLYCDTIIDKDENKGRRGMCFKHYQMWRIHGDPMHFDGRERKPNSHGYFRKGQKGEHRKVYEDYYGITLTHEQQIHHIDFNKTNNSIENLWLYNTGSEHTKAHRAYEKLRKQYPTGNIKFENGVYVYKGDENEEA